MIHTESEVWFQRPQVVVGTSMGLLYVLRGTDGSLRPGFPVGMGEIQAQVVPSDLDGDGVLELIAVDSAGSVAVWTAAATLLWEARVAGLCAQPVSVAPLLGDGTLQVVVPTAAGVIHVLHGRTGKEVAPFPLRTGGRVMSSVLVINLLVWRREGRGRWMDEMAPHLVFASFDGFLHVVHSRTGCVHKVDLGEHSYTQVARAPLVWLPGTHQ